jgi:deoxyribonuclease V
VVHGGYTEEFMKVKDLHSWNMDRSDAVEIQKLLKENIVIRDNPIEPSLVAGVDLSFPDKSTGLAVVAVLNFPELELLEYSYHVGKVERPYIPGLLSFREGPEIIEALKNTPEVDLVFFDGHGTAHPRGIGIASHIGLFLEVPTIGVAKSLLYGKCELPGSSRGDSSPILSPAGELIGYSLRTKPGVKPVYVSPGNGLSMKQALEFSLKATGIYRLPEPTRQAHILSQKLKAQLSL